MMEMIPYERPCFKATDEETAFSVAPWPEIGPEIRAGR